MNQLFHCTYHVPNTVIMIEHISLINIDLELFFSLANDPENKKLCLDGNARLVHLASRSAIVSIYKKNMWHYDQKAVDEHVIKYKVNGYAHGKAVTIKLH